MGLIPLFPCENGLWQDTANRVSILYVCGGFASSILASSSYSLLSPWRFNFKSVIAGRRRSYACLHLPQFLLCLFVNSGDVLSDVFWFCFFCSHSFSSESTRNSWNQLIRAIEDGAILLVERPTYPTTSLI